ncbi:VCBS domain-containing protein [Vibrio nigripulchritudo]|uniref:VCBS domain-containing protein n=1 Tax=Vibrio nigripulchritudo TaxID=28173 RepID=UPI0024910DE6|nr:VCBS domain-containing protein [Vibrio nigripulchritudo]BDU37090.1 hypothetical protein TUMSATVNIG2_15590 [Vibrio nigripulchritudo]
MDSIQSLLSSAIAGVGQMIVIDQQGNIRVVPKGTPLLPGEVVLEADGASKDGAAPRAGIVDDNQDINQLELDEDIQEIFAALEGGEDPTQLDDEFATAAGDASSGSSLTTSGEIERIGAQSIAETSFDTGSFERQGLSRTQSLTLLESYRILLTATTDSGPEGAPSVSIPEAVNSVNAEEAEDGVDLLITVPAGTTNEDTIFVEVSTPTGESVFIEVPVPDDWDGTSPIVVTIPSGNLNTDGSYTVTSEVFKPNGDSTSTSAPVTFDLDTTPPSTPTVTITEDANNDGTLSDDELDGQVTVTVQIPSDAEVGDVLKVTGQPDTIITQDMINAGSITLEYDRPADGETLDITATITDQAGNTSTAGNDSVVTEDNTPTGAPTVQILDDANNDGILTSDENDGSVDVRITLPEGVKVGDVLKVTGQPDIVINQEQIDVGFITVSYPVPEQNETLTVNATVTDSSGNVSATGSDSVTGENINDNPVIGDENGDPVGDSITVSVNEDTTKSGKLTASDVDGDDLTFSKGTDPSNGTVTVDADGNWSYTPNENYNGNDSFTVVVSDGNGGTDTITINVEVAAVNDDPTATAENVEVNEDASVTGQIEASDVDLPAGESLTFTTDEVVKGLTLNSDGLYTFDASEYDDLKEGQELVISVPVTVTDDAGGSTTTTLTITVTGSNDPADVTAGVANLTESDSVLSANGKLESTDPDGNDNTFKPTTINGTYGVLTLQADGTWNFESHTALDELDANDKVTEQFVVETEDGTKTTIDIKIQGTNDVPVVETQTQAWIFEDDTSKTVKGFTVNDPDASDSHTFTIVSQPDSSLGEFEMRADGSWTFVLTDTEAADKLPEGHKLNEVYQIEVKDSQGATTVVDVTVTIIGKNDAADVTAASKTLTETDAVLRTSGTLTHTDVDGADNTFKADTIEGDIGTLYMHKSGEWQFVANGTYDHLDDGEHVTETFNVFTEDGTPTTITIRIDGTNDAPVAVADTATTQEDNTVTIDVLANDTDAEDNTLTIKEASVPSEQGTVAIVDGKIVFTPADNFNGEATITYTVTDGKLDSEPSTVKVTVEAVNDEVGAVTDSNENDNTVAENAAIGTEVNITGLAVDPDGQKVTYSLTNDADGLFTINPETGVVTVNGALDHETSDSHIIEITATSEDGSKSSQTFVINVSDIDEIAPEAPGVTITEDANNDGLISDAELDGQVNVTISLEGTNAVAGDTLTVNGTNILLTDDHISAGEVLTSVDAPSEGETLTVEATITDIAGNVSEKGIAEAMVDTEIAAPELALNADTGSSDSDSLTNDGVVNVTLADEAVSWEYTTDGGTTWVTGTGTSFTLAEAEYADGAVQVRQTDAAGNTSNGVSLGAVTVDQTIAAPELALNADTGSSDSDSLTNDGVVNVTLADEAVSWEYTTDGGTTWVTGTGTSFTLAEAEYADGAVQVRQTDAAGNTSNGVSLGAVTVDQTIAAPELALNADTGSSDSDSLTNDGVVNVTLADEAVSWEYTTDGGTTWVTGTGTSFTLAEAEYADGAVQVRQTDAAGNTSNGVSLGAVTVDQTIAAPELALNADTGSSDSDSLTNDGVVNVTLADEAVSWEYTTDGGTTWVTGTGTSFTLAEAEYADGAVQVRQTDAAGNTSNGVSLGAVTVDQTIAAPELALNADTGSSDSDSLTNDGVVNVTLADEAVSWEYTTDGGTTWVTGTGTSFTLAEAEYADGAVQVRQTDAAGNTSNGVSLGAVTVDQTIAAPELALNADTGSSDSDSLTNDGVVNVTLADEAVSWEYTTDGGTTWVTGTGTSFTLAEAEYADGAVQVRQTDAAGNTSNGVSLGAVTVDQTIAAPELALNADTGSSDSDSLTNDGVVNVTLADEAVSWEYTTDGGTTWVTGTGTSFTLAEAEYADGAVQVRQTDAAGNTSNGVSLGAVTVDQTIAAPELALNADTGSSDSDSLTNDGVVNVTLADEAVSWEYTTDGGTTWVTGTGTSFTLAEAEYADGAVQVRQTDAAGNTSNGVSLGAVTVDQTIAAPELALNADTGSSDSDSLTNDGVVNVTLADEAVSWEYTQTAARPG